MVIRGKIQGSVYLSDIGKNIGFNQIIELNESEINKSKDLQNAIRQKWVEIVSGSADMLRAVAMPSQPQQIQQPTLDQTQMLELAREMAKTMVEEMMKNNTNIAKETATEMVSQLSDKMVVQQSNNIKEQEKIKLENEQTNSIVIDVDEKVMEQKSNIQEIGTVKEEKADISASLEKMKRFRRKP